MLFTTFEMQVDLIYLHNIKLIRAYHVVAGMLVSRFALQPASLHSVPRKSIGTAPQIPSHSVRGGRVFDLRA